MAGHPRQLGPEGLGQAAAFGVEALQVGVEVLAGRVHLVLGVFVVTDRAIAGQLGEIGKDLEQVELLARQPRVALAALALGEVALQGATVVLRVHVIAEQHRLDVGTTLRQRIAAVGRFVGQVEVDRLLRGSRGGLRSLVVDHRVDPQERRARLHLVAGGHEHLPHDTSEGGGQDGLHLHRLEDDGRGALCQFVAGR